VTTGKLRVTAIAAASLLWACNAFALSFDERWKSLFSEAEVTGERVAAKAELVRRAERPERVQRHRAHRHRFRTSRGERRREWYKGGKKWHYVYARKKTRR
jgi:hypothetical protein